MLIETKRTTCTDAELITGLVKSWQKIFNKIPSKQSICIILAQHMIETGKNSCWNWNLCNIKYVKSNGDVPYTSLHGVWEIVNGKRVELTPQDPGSWFRAFNTLDEGCDFYLKFLNGKRYAKAWTAIEAGDPKNFSHLLHVAGYYTDNEDHYTNSLLGQYNRFMKMDTYDKVVKDLTKVEASPEESVPVNLPEVLVESEPVEDNTEMQAVNNSVNKNKIVKKSAWSMIVELLKNIPWVKLIETVMKLVKKK